MRYRKLLAIALPVVLWSGIAPIAIAQSEDNSAAEFERLLQQRHDRPDRAEQIDRQIRATFGETRAILVLDMSGFSRISEQEGIIAALAQIEQMRDTAIPPIEQQGGRVVKAEADNILAVFPDVDSAVNASIAIHRTLRSRPEIAVSIGIGYGDILAIGEVEIFGEQVNLASKLGEDLAEAEELLITDVAYEQIEANREGWVQVEAPISGLDLVFYRWQGQGERQTSGDR